MFQGSSFYLDLQLHLFDLLLPPFNRVNGFLLQCCNRSLQMVDFGRMLLFRFLQSKLQLLLKLVL